MILLAKRCSTCKRSAPEVQFSKNRRTRDGLQNVCNFCKHDYWNAWHKRSMENPEVRGHIAALKRQRMFLRALEQYNITGDEYKILEQLGCAICGGPPVGRGRFHFDHNHKTGEFRGLLCHRCNTALGLLHEDITVFERAIAYLKSAPFAVIE